MVETGFVRIINEDTYAVFGENETNWATFQVLVGKTLAIPLTLKNIKVEHAEIIFVTSDGNLELGDYRIEQNKLIVRAKKPGNVSIRIFVKDKLLPHLDPKEDEPLNISIGIL